MSYSANSNGKRFGFRLLSIVLLLSVLLPGLCKAELKRTEWKPLFKGICRAAGKAEESSPRLQVVNALRIDLTEPNIVFITTPSNGDIPGETTRQTAEQFIDEFDVQVAVNTHFYHTSAEINWKAELHGLCVSNGHVVSGLEDLPHNGMSLLITKDNKARFEKTTPEFELDGVWTAIEAWPILVKDGKNAGDNKTVHPRTAIGLSQDSRYMIIITIDGRQKDYSIGATFYETAQWLLEFGAYQGLNLDGGGSTHLWVSSPKYGTRSLNKPSENRAVACHLGIYADPLD